MDSKQAQARVERILAFEAELDDLLRDGVLTLSDSDSNAIAAYHTDLRGRLASEFDVDLTMSEHQLSWGMRIASTLGAIALTFAVFLFFEHYWDRFETLTQVVLVTAAPFVAWIVVEILAWRFATAYFTSLAALVAIACFVANLHIVADIYNVTPSPNALLAWGLFGLFLAWRHDLPIVLSISVAGLIAFSGAALTHYSGFVWPQVYLPEFYAVGSVLCLAVPLVARGRFFRRRGPVFRFIGLLSLLGFLGHLMLWPSDSLLPLSRETLELIYAIAPFAIATLAVWWSIWRQASASTYLSATFLAVFMVQKYHDWFWDALPHYLFFLALGAITVAVIVLLRHLRQIMRPAT